MATLHGLTLCARVTLDLHNLNNEGTEGNQQQTRMVTILDEKGDRRVVNAISGDMLKHIVVEHLIPLLDQAGQPLSPGARAHDADRITAANPEFNHFAQDKKNSESSILTRMLTSCSLTDIAGALVTGGRAVARKSVVELGWAVGLPDVTITEQFFHVKYAPEGRGAGTGQESVSGTQAIFHRPASSGIYAVVCNLDLWRIGQNDITREYVVSRADRTARARALLYALSALLVKPTGAQRATQAPHVLGLDGAIATSSTTLPAPMVSPLASDFVDQMERIASTYNRIAPNSVAVWPVGDVAACVDRLARLAAEMEAPETLDGRPD